MKFKLVPEPPSPTANGADPGEETGDAGDVESVLAEMQAAVPLVPGSEDDCCARLMRRRDLPSRDVARTWLTFLRALGLAEETPSGFRRVRESASLADLRRAFIESVYGADVVAETLAQADSENPLRVEDAFDALRDRVPTWERNRTDDWESVWRERARRHLDWFVSLGLAERRGGGYVPTDALAPEEV
ncbi:hypothetical protein [Halorarum halobium]|uniref:hypothetical protein n=1 Tax=Halorarum halobium TaxID=3075121 RepID=UPI0028A817F7|nr:hypothetical protein [Halobaculum sp. XH14]